MYVRVSREEEDKRHAEPKDGVDGLAQVSIMRAFCLAYYLSVCCVRVDLDLLPTRTYISLNTITLERLYHKGGSFGS